MIRIAVTEAAFEAIAATLPLASEPEVDAMGERVLWVDQPVADRLSAMREPGESSSDVILRLVLRLVTAERRRADFKSYSRPTVGGDGRGLCRQSRPYVSRPPQTDSPPLRSDTGASSAPAASPVNWS